MHLIFMCVFYIICRTDAKMHSCIHLVNFVLILLPFSIIHCDDLLTDHKFYVKPWPVEPSFCPCPVGNVTCETLDFYTNFLAHHNVENFSLSLIFLCGHHTLQNSSTDTTNVNGLHYLSVQGDGHDPSHVVIKGINLVIQSVPLLRLENVTIKDVSFQVYPSSINNHVLFSITNCYFNHSHSFIVGSNLTVQDTVITDGVNTAFSLIHSTLTLKGNIQFLANNGEQGGALRLTSTQLNISRNATVTFANNHAVSRGGAIFVDNPTEIFKVFPYIDCFYQLLDYSEGATYNVTFTNNSAPVGGKHIFGAPLKSYCTAAVNSESDALVPSYSVVSKDRKRKIFHFDEQPSPGNSVSSFVSSSPARVCICNESGQYGIPLCSDSTKIFLNVKYYPGELFTLPAVLVGADFGPTVGIAHAQLLIQNDNHQQSSNYLDDRARSQLMRTTNCTNLNYTIYSSNRSSELALMQLTAFKSNLVWDPNQKYRFDINTSIDQYHNKGVIEGTLMFTPLFVNVTLKPCPLGFNLRLMEAGTKSRCDCYQPLKTTYKSLKCRLTKSSGSMSVPKCWIGASSFSETEVVLSEYFCPFCIVSKDEQWVDVQSEESIFNQCASNHVGRLCGGCREGYSLAIGSSSCIKCFNNNGLALLIFFAVAGFLLVLVVTALNLTVTQGMINGVIFYANIVWIYESVLFPREHASSLLFFRIFIAWLNLDFGIEMCFVEGLNGFWKSLLQYIFPMYVCSIVGVIIWGARHSTRVTNLLGSKAVSVLSSLILLSFTKLLRNIYTSMNYASLFYYDREKKVRTLIVWATDGQLKYVASEHAVLFFIALIAVCLCLIYTLVLLFGQWLRRLSYFSRFHPVFDSYFAPIKRKHHYLLGVLLITRVFLYLLNIFLYDHNVAIFILLITIVLLLSYMAVVQPLKSRVGFVFYITFLVNLIILSGSALFINSTTVSNEARSMKIVYITGVSTAVAFLEFCLLVVYRLIKNIRSVLRRSKYQNMKDEEEEDQSQYEQNTNSTYSSFRDSILEDSVPPRLLVSYSD